MEVVESVDIKAGGSKKLRGTVGGASYEGKEGRVWDYRAWGGVAKEQVEVNSRAAKEGNCADELGVARLMVTLLFAMGHLGRGPHLDEEEASGGDLGGGTVGGLIGKGREGNEAAIRAGDVWVYEPISGEDRKGVGCMACNT